MVKQFAIYGLRDAPTQFVIVLQSDVVDLKGTVVVAPLIQADLIKRVRQLNPVIAFREREYLLIVNQLSAIPGSELTGPSGNAESSRDAISNALDFLFHGF